MKPEELQDRLLRFAARIGAVADVLPDTRLGRHISGQLIRCGTSPAPNYSEACAAESRNDFVHKLSICLKELRETHVWLRLIVLAKILPSERLDDLLQECVELSNIIGKSIATTKGKGARVSSRN